MRDLITVCLAASLPLVYAAESQLIRRAFTLDNNATVVPATSTSHLNSLVASVKEGLEISTSLGAAKAGRATYRFFTDNIVAGTESGSDDLAIDFQGKKSLMLNGEGKPYITNQSDGSSRASQMVNGILHEAGLLGGPGSLIEYFDGSLPKDIFPIKGPKKTPEQEAAEKAAKATTSPDIMQDERCQALNRLAENIEGLATSGNDELILSTGEWNNMLVAFEPIYTRAYHEATLSQINKISNTSVGNWGAPLEVPSRLEPAERTKDKNREKYDYEKEKKKWVVNEFLRPIHLQQDLMTSYHNSIHELALVSLKNATDLPWAAESAEFAFAYSSLVLRMAITPDCEGHVREHPRIRTWLTGPRALQQGREIMLYAAARELFAAQSRLDPTLPL